MGTESVMEWNLMSVPDSPSSVLSITQSIRLQGEFCEFHRPQEDVLLQFEVQEPAGVQYLQDALAALGRAAHLGGFEVAEDGRALFRRTAGLCGRQRLSLQEAADLPEQDFGEQPSAGAHLFAEPFAVLVQARLLMACGRLAEHHHTEVFTCYNSAFDVVHKLNSLRIYDVSVARACAGISSRISELFK